MYIYIYVCVCVYASLGPNELSSWWSCQMMYMCSREILMFEGGYVDSLSCEEIFLQTFQES